MNLKGTGNSEAASENGRGTLVVGGLAAILASVCCLGPLVLLMLGFSGAWIGTLTVIEPYRPIFVGVAVIALLLSYRRIFRPTAECAPGEICAIPAVRSTYKWLFWVVAALILIALSYPFLAPLFY